MAFMYRSSSPLVSASDRGNFETVKRLLEQGADVNQKDENLQCALYRAAWRGHLQVAKLLLQYQAQVNSGNRLPNFSSLMTACETGHITITRLLLDCGANVNMQGSEGWSALMFSSETGQTETAKLLLDHGANVNMQNNKGNSALYVASQDGHTETAKLLLDHGANVNMQNNEGFSALRVSSAFGHTETAKLLLDRGANVNMQSNEGVSALYISSQDGHTETAKLLLDHGANVNTQRNDGVSALYISSQNGHIETTNLLLESGANVNMQRHNGSSALTVSSEMGQSEIVRLLLSHGADINLRHNSGRSAFMFANQYGHFEIDKLISEHEAFMLRQNMSPLIITCQKGHTETARHLLQLGVDTNMQTTDGWSALMYAVQNGFVETVKMLIQYKADVNIHLKDGFSALMCASQYRHTEIAKLLLNSGANVNALKVNGWSALMSASLSGSVDIAKNLIAYGAQINHQMNDGLSPLIIACQNGHTEVAKILLEHGANPKLQDRDGWNALLFAQFGGHNEIIELLQSEERKRIVVSQESKPSAAQTSTTQTTRSAGKTLQPPSPYYAPTPGPSSVDSGYASSWGSGPSPAPSWMSVPSPGSALSPAPSSGVLSPAGSEFGLPPSPAQPSPLPPKSPYPAKYTAFKQMSSSVSIAQQTSDQDITEHLVAETSVLVTNSERLFSWDECGLNLYIPENSLPANLQQCSIHIKATIMGDYQLPQDTHLVSAVYWIECVPKCQFSQPITLEIQHCAKPEGASKLCFVKAKSMDHDEERVNFETVAGNFSHHSSYGFIELDSFSGYGVGKKGAKQRQYCASIYYSEENKNHRIHFTVFWNTKVHNEIIRTYYEKMNATLGHDQRFEFKRDQNLIRLDIPPEGTTTRDNAWTITALGPPVIERTEVDSFKKGKRIPSCQLIAESETERPTTLKHLVTLSGAKDPHNTFTIYRQCDSDMTTIEPQGTGRKRGHSDPEGADSEPGPSNPKRSRMTDGGPRQPEVISPLKFSALLKELLSKVSADWEDIGLALELKEGQLSAIKSDHRDSNKCFREMLKLWLKQVEPPPTWSAIIDAIDILEYESLAEELRKKYC